jgi:beta-lactamase regulating signal transducer with metallopeptidase domain
VWWGWVDQLGRVVFGAAVAAAVLSSFVMLLMLGSQQPARRIALARAALCGTLVLVPLVVFAPLPRFDVPTALEASGLFAHPLLARGQAAATLGLLTPWPARVLLLVYLAGVGVCFTELAVGYWGLGWLTRNAQAPSPRAQAVYDAIPTSGRSAVGRARPKLQVAARIRRPVLVGMYQATILIPPALDPGTAHADANVAAALRLSLLHELAHAERLDVWFSLAGSLARTFWFFLPPLWWIRAQMRLDQEFLADQHAACAFGAPATYASALVALAGPGPAADPAARRPSPAATSTEPLEAMGATRSPGSPLFQRILMLVSCPIHVEHRPPGWWRWSLPILTLLITPMVACLSFDLGTWGRPAKPVAPQPLTFRVARLAIAPQNPDSRGRSPLHEFPLILPARFNLSVEAWGNRATLSRCRVIGQRIAPPEAAAAVGLDMQAEPETWHHVQIERRADGRQLSVTFDGQPVPRDPVVDRVTNRLTLEPPPGRPARFRNLRVDCNK